MLHYIDPVNLLLFDMFQPPSVVSSFDQLFYYQQQICIVDPIKLDLLKQAAITHAISTNAAITTTIRLDTTPSFYFLSQIPQQPTQPIAVKMLTEQEYQVTVAQGWLWQSGRDLITSLPLEAQNRTEWSVIAKALHLAQWLESYPFCAKCGHQKTLPIPNITLPLIGLTCTQCGHVSYPPIAPCVIGLITQQNKLLLARHIRSKQPVYTLIAGFVEPGESIEQAFQREALEECGVTVQTPHYIASQPWPFPAQLMIGLQAEYKAGQLKIDETELVDAQFFAVDNLPLLPVKGTISRYLIDQHCQRVTQGKI